MEIIYLGKIKIKNRIYYPQFTKYTIIQLICCQGNNVKFLIGRYIDF